MPSPPLILRQIGDLRAQIAPWRASGQRIGLVPTMGALHDGHLALVRRALESCDRVIVSIFVNPTQFGPNEDYAAYPRHEAEDVAKVFGAGGHLVWAPGVEMMYPPRFSTHVTVETLTETLCGPHRPGHFQGVATVVTKLLLQVLADQAFFGEKDWQQLQVIRRLARDLDIPTEIKGVATIREADGLALSSRNAYLSAEERLRAALLPRVLTETAEAAAAGLGSLMELIRAARAALSEAGFGPIDYIAFCDAETLQPVERLNSQTRIFVAARLGRTRLIDNMPVPPG